MRSTTGRCATTCSPSSRGSCSRPGTRATRWLRRSSSRRPTSWCGRRARGRSACACATRPSRSSSPGVSSPACHGWRRSCGGAFPRSRPAAAWRGWRSSRLSVRSALPSPRRAGVRGPRSTPSDVIPRSPGRARRRGIRPPPSGRDRAAESELCLGSPKKEEVVMAVRRVSLPLLAALALAGAAVSDEDHSQHRHGSGEPEKLGRVAFPVSCNEAAGETFGRAVALLHSFWYGEAEKAFTDVTGLDPSCVMGHWGVAMSNFHPIWAPPTPAEFERGRAAVARAQAAPAKTDRERDYIAAVASFYEGDGGDFSSRKLAYEKAMEEVHQRHPEDREAAIFYAPALLGTAPPTDKTYTKQKKAAEILNTILPSAPEHPGVAHYLIHSFDYPALAELALPAAHAYSKIAASSPHALHIPSHIFTRLALWDDSIQSNIASATTAERYVEKTMPGAASFDELHALDYLAYAYLQQARDDKAKEVMGKITAVERLDLPNFAAAYALAAVPARYALERRQWKEAAALTVRPASFPSPRDPSAQALTQFS